MACDHRYKHGFALPTIVIASLVLFMVLVAAVGSASSIRAALDTQLYQQLAKDAAESGAAQANECLAKNNYSAPWSSSSPLRPNTNCSGGAACTDTAKCFVVKTLSYNSTYSIGSVSDDGTGALVFTINAIVAMTRVSSGEVWKTYSSTVKYSVGKIQYSLPSTPTPGGAGTIAAYPDGNLRGWGCNDTGQFGDGTTTKKLTPSILTALPGANNVIWSQTSSTNGTVHALKSDGSVWGWGYNGDGAVGNGSTTNQLTPVQIIASGASKLFIGIGGTSVSHLRVFALKSDGSLWGWGYNGDGAVGNGSTTNQLTPVQIIASGVSNVYTTAYSTYVIKTDGSIWAWGSGTNGAVGNGSTTNQLTPVQIIASGASSFYPSWFGAYVIKTDGSLWAWGSGTNGAVGNGSTTNQLTPVQIIASGVVLAAVSSSPNTARFVIKSDGSLWGWGYNGSGAVGNGSTTNQLTPVQIIASGVTKMSAKSVSLAIKSDGSLWGWGYNTTYGSVGNNSTINQLTPVQIISNGVQLADSDGYSSYALKTDGSLWIWGNNTYGIVGNNTSIHQLTPFNTINNIAEVGFTTSLVYATKTDGTTWAWGHNSNCSLTGTGLTTQQSTPVKINIPPVIKGAFSY